MSSSNRHRRRNSLTDRWNATWRRLCSPRRPPAGSPTTAATAATGATATATGTAAAPVCPICHRRPATCEVRNACDPSRRFWCCGPCLDEMERQDRSWFFWAHKAGRLPRSDVPEYEGDDETRRPLRLPPENLMRRDRPGGLS